MPPSLSIQLYGYSSRNARLAFGAAAANGQVCRRSIVGAQRPPASGVSSGLVTSSGSLQIFIDLIELETFVSKRQEALAHALTGCPLRHLIDQFLVLRNNALKHEVSLDTDGRQHLPF